MRAILDSIIEIERGSAPLIAVGLHAAHEVRDSLVPDLAITDSQRLREEDPLTDFWTTVCPNRVVARRSRFEVDLNRPPRTAVYREPADAWGLNVWRGPLREESLAKSMAEYRRFYAHMDQVLTQLANDYGHFVLLDVHSYNHRRLGPGAPAAAPELNPEVNVGTGSLDRRRWGALVDRFISDLRGHPFLGRQLDVRENVNFLGGYLVYWVHERFPESGCALAIEFKKFFMDEWSGFVDLDVVQAIHAALGSTLAGLLEELERL